MTSIANKFSDFQGLDTLADSTASALGGETCLISVIDDRALFALGHSGYPGPDDSRAIPASDTICQYTIRLRRPVKINDVSTSPILHAAPATLALDIGSYLGAPIWLNRSKCVGAICVLNRSSCEWSDDQVFQLERTAELAAELIEVRMLRAENNNLNELVGDFDRIIATLSKTGRAPQSVHDRNGEVLFANEAMISALGLEPGDLGKLPCALLESGLSEGGNSDLSVRVDLGDGRIRWLKVKCIDAGNGMVLCDWEPPKSAPIYRLPV